MIPIDVHRAANRARFARLVAHEDGDIDLALSALCVAADGRPELEFEPTLRQLEALAERVRIRLDLGDDLDAILGALHAVLYREHRLRAPTRAGSHDPRASRIDEVLARRIGLPIMLSIVELEVAWRIGLPLHGVGLPGHFIVGGPGGILIDPAGGGRTLGPDDCETLLRDALGADVRLHPGLLRPVRRREIVARVLRNLRVAHLAARDWAAALGIVELLEVVEPTEPDHERDRGLLLGRMGRFTEAIGLLHRYLEVRPDASDAEDVRQVIGIFRGRRN